MSSNEGGKGDGKGGTGNGTSGMRVRCPVSVLMRILIDMGVPLRERINTYNVFAAAVAQNTPHMLVVFQAALSVTINLGETLDGSAEQQVLEDHLITLMHGIETGQFQNNQGLVH